MYNIEKGNYTCDICGFEMKWDESDDIYREVWSCEVCGEIFCSKCFKDAHGDNKYYEMMRSGEYIRCPQCFEKAERDVKR